MEFVLKMYIWSFEDYTVNTTYLCLTIEHQLYCFEWYGLKNQKYFLEHLMQFSYKLSCSLQRMLNSSTYLRKMSTYTVQRNPPIRETLAYGCWHPNLHNYTYIFHHLQFLRNKCPIPRTQDPPSFRSPPSSAVDR